MSARDTILGALRAVLGPNRPDRAAIAAEAAALLADPAAIRPALAAEDPVEAFAARVVSPKVNATLERIDGLSELPALLRRYLETHALAPDVTVQPDPVLRALDWTGVTIRDSALPDEAVAVGRARWGIAETGSLVFESGPETAVLNHFLPLHHVVAISAGDILPYLEDHAAVMGAAPRNLNLITGASGTTDIEGSYVRGAHGPRFLHIVLVGS